MFDRLLVPCTTIFFKLDIQLKSWVIKWESFSSCLPLVIYFLDACADIHQYRTRSWGGGHHCWCIDRCDQEKANKKRINYHLFFVCISIIELFKLLLMLFWNICFVSKPRTLNYLFSANLYLGESLINENTYLLKQTLGSHW